MRLAEVRARKALRVVHGAAERLRRVPREAGGRGRGPVDVILVVAREGQRHALGHYAAPPQRAAVHLDAQQAEEHEEEPQDDEDVEQVEERPVQGDEDELQRAEEAERLDDAERAQRAQPRNAGAHGWERQVEDAAAHDDKVEHVPALPDVGHPVAHLGRRRLLGRVTVAAPLRVGHVVVGSVVRQLHIHVVRPVTQVLLAPPAAARGRRTHEAVCSADGADVGVNTRPCAALVVVVVVTAGAPGRDATTCMAGRTDVAGR
mmetsp:Transcript_7919/g.28132  ORF Transcript_7919/g.28132 Transcript_7919/m.28132 type:complete len:261 (+) Transcript_7919:5242-6024(+)